MACLLLREDGISSAQVDLGKRANRLGRLCVVAHLERDPERVLQERNRVVWPPEQEVQSTEVV